MQNVLEREHDPTMMRDVRDCPREGAIAEMTRIEDHTLLLASGSAEMLAKSLSANQACTEEVITAENAFSGSPLRCISGIDSFLQWFIVVNSLFLREILKRKGTSKKRRLCHKYCCKTSPSVRSTRFFVQKSIHHVEFYTPRKTKIA